MPPFPRLHGRHAQLSSILIRPRRATFLPSDYSHELHDDYSALKHTYRRSTPSSYRASYLPPLPAHFKYRLPNKWASLLITLFIVSGRLLGFRPIII